MTLPRRTPAAIALAACATLLVTPAMTHAQPYEPPGPGPDGGSGGQGPGRGEGCAVGSGAAPASVPFGLFGPDRRAVSLDRRLQLYSSLGIRWLRFNTTVPPSASHGMTDPEEIPAFRDKGYDVFLTVINPALDRGGSDPELGTYAGALRDTVARYRPTMIAVENEADNPPYAVAAGDYMAELRSACAVAHQAGVQCTDSGLTTKMQVALLVDWDLHRGDVAAAQRDARYLGLWYADKPPPGASPDVLAAYLSSKGVDRARAMITGLREAGADRVDLHWYVRPGRNISQAEQDGQLLTQVIAMLQYRTGGLPVAVGEVGIDSPHMQDTDARPDDIHDLVTSLANAGAQPIIVWNPGAGLFRPNPHALSLVDASGAPLPAAAGLVRAAREHGAGASDQRDRAQASCGGLSPGG